MMTESMISPLLGRRILLGVTGGIAAYKSPDLVRRLRESGAEVRVVMTAGAEAFLTPLTLQAVSGTPVRTSLLDAEAEAGMDHIELARWPDSIVIAPATADFMARLAHGLADDLLATLCLATDRPIVLAPAMNRLMWSNPATRDNARTLESRNIRLLGPGEGSQACGETGPGRMLEPLDILRALEEQCSASGGALSGLRVLITAGPTVEAIDPVRYISNRSSGKMGFAVAEAAAREGAEVTVVAGPVRLPTPPGVARVDVQSAADMHAAVMHRVPDSQVFIATAAVSDYRVAVPEERKIKKTEQSVTLTLSRNPDILADVAALSGGPFTVGFAAETHDLLTYAEDKRLRKNLDMIAANLVGENIAFDQDENELQVLWEGGRQSFARAPKRDLAKGLVALIAERYHARG